MKLIIVSGRSGSGKTTCLHVLEDLEYYCVDNIPASLLPSLAKRLADDGLQLNQVAVSIDARNLSEDLLRFPQIYQSMRETGVDSQIIFLDADDNILIKRFSETRRKHPLSNHQRGLMEAVTQEKKLLEPIAGLADLTLDTSGFTLHQLRDVIKDRVAGSAGTGMALQFQSFGFKHGIPIDADLVYDVRCLPNPHWIDTLRPLTGLEQPVIDYLEAQSEVGEMCDDIRHYLLRWLPRYQASSRRYITVAIGCTGGQHRSVFLCEKLGRHFKSLGYNVQVRHKESV